ncbi:hypothetical protein BV898_14181 [Hypsibius exemplaris]|uniref:Uncharacterized protein n=1 Tax=Hypsibius exemplaris TaxID=2072580 RepID=A0A1W0W8J4_HYPEX|nr:hypothetical protein BV898_14181 [Hypsibius exemplaris]
MFFTLKEASIWTGLSPFELLWQTLAVALFSVLLALKTDGVSQYGDMSWTKVFVPLFVANCVNAYFIAIVFIRSVLTGQVKKALQRSGWTLVFLALLSIYHVLLCQKLQGTSDFSHPETMAPLFILLVLTVFRSR